MENSNLKTSPKDVFLHLFNIFAFYMSIVGFITLYIQYISALYPDPLNFYFTAVASAVRTSTSILVISVPAYLISTWFIEKDLLKTPEKRDLKLRQWLIYFTLFISAITVVIDLIIFVYNFLDGDLSIQFFLKIITVLVVATAVFLYYIWELKRSSEKSNIPKIFAVLVVVIATASIIAGFFIIGTPSDQRNRRFDDQRISSLQLIQSQIVDFWSKKDSLPKSLKDLENNISGFITPLDPNTKEAYEYTITGPLSFELCATFSMSSEDFIKSKSGANVYGSPYGSFQQNWNHEIGRSCWTRTIDPDLYKNDKLIDSPPVR